MDLTNALYRMRHRKLALLAAALLGAVAFVLITFHVSSDGLQRKSTTQGSAQTELLVDSQRSSLIRVSNLNGELADRAILIAQFAQSPSIQKRMSEALHRPRDSFKLASSTSTLTSPGGGSSSGGDASSQTPLPAPGTPGVVFRASGGLPVVGITASAPTAKEAQQLAGAARTALIDTVKKVGTSATSKASSSSSSSQQPDDKSYPLLLRPVSDADGATVTTVSSLGKGIGAGVGVFVVLGLLSLLVGRPRRDDDQTAGPTAPASGEAAAIEAYESFRHNMNGHDRELVPSGARSQDRAAEDEDRDDA